METYRLEDERVFIVRLNINGAEFWVNESTDSGNLNNINVRMILTVPNPEEIFDKAIQAGVKKFFLLMLIMDGSLEELNIL